MKASVPGIDHAPLNLLRSMKLFINYGTYLLPQKKHIYPMGPQLCEKAKEIAEHLEIPDFKASNGWLGRWKRRYNVKKMKINGESGDVRGETVDSWNLRRGYLSF